MIRGQDGQVVTANLVNRFDGSEVISGTVTVEVLGHGGTKVPGVGTIENEGGGTWTYYPTAAETDYQAITFSFTHNDAIRVDVQVNPCPAVTAGVDGLVAAGAAGPRSAAADGVNMTAHSLPDLIAAEKYLAAKSAGSSRFSGLRFARLVPPGTTSNSEDAR